MILSLALTFASCFEKKEDGVPTEPNVQTAQADAPQGILPGDLPDENEPDCDKKAKEATEPAEIKLQGGDTGCSLDEVNK